MPAAAAPSRRATAAEADARRGAADVSARTWVDTFTERGRPAVIAHRGEHRVSQGQQGNDIGSLQRAASGGESDVVEADTQVLGDGTIVVFHDPSTMVGHQPRRLTDMTIEEFRKLHPKSPTLERWALEAGRRDVNVLVDVKGKGYEANALEILQRHIDADDLAISSFRPDVLNAFHALDPTLDLGLFAARPTRMGYVKPVARQLDELTFTPAFVELVGTNDGPTTMRTLAERDIPVMFGGYSVAEQHTDDTRQRVVGIITNSPKAVDRRLDEIFGEDEEPILYQAPGHRDATA